MPDDIEKLYDICDEIYKKYREESRNLNEKIAKDFIEKLEQSGIPLRDYRNEEKTMWTDSKQKLMAIDRIISLFENDISFDILFS